ncbi:hypothetical protein [Kitasatospora sp. NPDC059599]|uniref:hypothetical protein n=1 Tax=Kitasatospora sp. NPDC059599 TaxID=3346880 RepID=UPI0036B6E2B5
MSALSATAGFIPLHAVWALGVPLWADEAKFRDWYAGGGQACSPWARWPRSPAS